jgi:hypothetical protein
MCSEESQDVHRKTDLTLLIVAKNMRRLGRWAWKNGDPCVMQTRVSGVQHGFGVGSVRMQITGQDAHSAFRGVMTSNSNKYQEILITVVSTVS